MALVAGAVQVPDSLWSNNSICEGAKVLWCYLRLETPQRFSFRTLRAGVGVCQNSLLKYLRQLKEAGWLSWTRIGLRTIDCQILTRRGPAISIPTDLLHDRKLPHAAKWVWGVINRTKSHLHYKELIRQTGYCQESIAKYIQQLTESRWLQGTVQRVMRLAQFALQVLNPLELKRQQELNTLKLGMALAKEQKGYSLGQYLLARMARVITAPNTLLIENAELVGLDNPETGGRMHYDLFLPQYRLALEYHGRQHHEPTELYPSEQACEAQQRRDRLKAELSYEADVELHSLTAQNLSFDYLRTLLDGRVPLCADMKGREHLYDLLERAAAAYRRRANEQSRRR